MSCPRRLYCNEHCFHISRVLWGRGEELPLNVKYDPKMVLVRQIKGLNVVSGIKLNVAFLLHFYQLHGGYFHLLQVGTTEVY